MARYDTKKESKRSFENITILFVVILICILVIVVLINFMFGFMTKDTFFVEVMNSIFGVIIPLLIFNLVYQKMTQSHLDLETSDKIVDSMMLEEKVLTNFSPEAKMNYIKSLTESLLGKNEGNMLFTTLMSPYLENKYNFRRNFRYNVAYEDDIDLTHEIGQETITFSKNDYDVVTEELNFERSMNHFNLKERKITAGFSYGIKDLEPLFKGDGEGVFFRENFHITAEHQDFLKSLDPKEITSFVQGVLKFKFELENYELQYTVKNSEEGFYIEFDIDDRIEITPDKVYAFKYTFVMPQLKTENKFIAIISEPTEKVDIFFTHTNRNIKISAIPFFDDSEALNYLPNNVVKIELDKWVLPRSGVVFTWDQKKNEIC